MQISRRLKKNFKARPAMLYGLVVGNKKSTWKEIDYDRSKNIKMDVNKTKRDRSTN